MIYTDGPRAIQSRFKRETVKRAEIDGPTRNVLTNLDENEYVIATQGRRPR